MAELRTFSYLQAMVYALSGWRMRRQKWPRCLTIVAGDPNMQMRVQNGDQFCFKWLPNIESETAQDWEFATKEDEKHALK